MDYILFILLGKDDPRACQVILNLNKANIISLQRGMLDTGAGWAGHWVDISASKSSIRRFVITEKAPTRAFSWLKALLPLSHIRPWSTDYME